MTVSALQQASKDNKQAIKYAEDSLMTVANKCDLSHHRIQQQHEVHAWDYVRNHQLHLSHLKEVRECQSVVAQLHTSQKAVMQQQEQQKAQVHTLQATTNGCVSTLKVLSDISPDERTLTKPDSQPQTLKRINNTLLDDLQRVISKGWKWKVIDVGEGLLINKDSPSKKPLL